ncbi:hypothetical protein DERF_009164 [Dermatophagoides farinae]|uniref:Uncharacterized protein n=1 Tax=Dermatophagoides farinae TaxID=6954 RepID=A0A922HTF8_DERFA|nr:hypothetical protein DERF_009164 [Dermatophagoides farinae]
MNTPFINDHFHSHLSYNLISPPTPERPRAISQYFNSALTIRTNNYQNSNTHLDHLQKSKLPLIIISTYHCISVVILDGTVTQIHTTHACSNSSVISIYQSDLTIRHHLTHSVIAPYVVEKLFHDSHSLTTHNASHLVHHLTSTPPQTLRDHTPQSFSITIQKPTRPLNIPPGNLTNTTRMEHITVNFDDDKITLPTQSNPRCIITHEIDNCVKSSPTSSLTMLTNNSNQKSFA